MTNASLRCIVFVAVTLVDVGLVWPADRLPVPGGPEQEAARARIRLLLEDDYSKTSKGDMVALADKLSLLAAEEEDGPSKYVMSAEAINAAVKAGSLERAVYTAVQIEQSFNAPKSKDALASAIAEIIGTKESLQELAAAELARPDDSKGKLELAKKWHAASKTSRAGSQLAAVHRARRLLCEVLASDDLKGLARPEAEKLCKVVTDEIDRLDAKAKRFSLYEGTWVVE